MLTNVLLPTDLSSDHELVMKFAAGLADIGVRRVVCAHVVDTARCLEGEWQANRCTGRLVASERYRFRALRAHHEVLFWTMGDKGPSGRYSDCDIVDGHNWSCKANADAARTITHQMTQGRHGKVGLPAAGRPPEDERGDLVGLDGPPEHAARPQHVLLPDELLQAARPQPLRQGLAGRVLVRGVVE